MAIDILRPLLKTKSGNQFIEVLTDRYSKLTKVVPAALITAISLATIFVNHCLSNFCFTMTVLTDKSTKYMSKFFQPVCAMLLIALLTTKEYHPRTSGQVERYNATIVFQLRHYVLQHHEDWDGYVPPLTYTYNVQVHQSTKLIPFTLFLSQHPSCSATPKTTTTTAAMDNIDSTLMIRIRLINVAALHRQQAEKTQNGAQQCYKSGHNKKVRLEPLYAPVDYLLVDRPPLTISVAERSAVEGYTDLMPK